MKVLITGGLGFIGSALTNMLYYEHDVTVLTRSLKGMSRLKSPERVTILEKSVCDVTSEDCSGKDLVIHCASTVDNYHVLTDPYIDIQTNCMGTIALLEACKVSKPRLIYVSTFFVYGNAPDLPVDESSPCAPRALYPATKLCAEHFCLLYHRLYGLPVTICRLSNVYGLGESTETQKKGVLNYLIRSALRSETLEVYNGGDFFRDYLYIDDAVRALWTVAQCGATGELYLVGSGQWVWFREVIQRIHELTGRKSAILSIPPLGFHKAVGITNFSMSIDKIKAIGWAPTVTFEDGLARTIASYAS